MADSEEMEEVEEFETDVIYMQLLERCEGADTAEQVANFCDQIFDFLRRKTRTLHLKRSGPLIKQKLQARIATAKADYINPDRNKPKKEDPRRFPPGMSPEERQRDMQGAEDKKTEEPEEMEEQKQVNEIEELDPSTMQPVMEDKKIEVEEEEEESGELPNAGNGGTTDTYSWTQTLDDVDIRIPVPSNVKGRMLKVDVEKKRIYVGIKGQKPIIDGELDAEVVESMWTLETEKENKVICINMDKRQGMCWWKRIVKGDVGIQTKKVQPENSKLSDLDGDTRKQVEQMMFDQRQRERGLPTSKEQAQRDKLANFMEMHPEMDFSKAKFGDSSGRSGW